MATITMPNGQTYDLSDPAQRQAARDANPGYVVDDTGYLLRGSGGESPGQPNPAVQGGRGSQSPNGYPASLPPITLTNDALNQVAAAASANTIPSGPGGSYIFPIAQLVSGGVTLNEAVHRVLAQVQGAAADLSAGGSGLLGGSNNPSGGAPAPAVAGLGSAGASSKMLLYAGIGLGLFLLMGGRR